MKKIILLIFLLTLIGTPSFANGQYGNRLADGVPQTQKCINIKGGEAISYGFSKITIYAPNCPREYPSDGDIKCSVPDPKDPYDSNFYYGEDSDQGGRSGFNVFSKIVSCTWEDRREMSSKPVKVWLTKQCCGYVPLKKDSLFFTGTTVLYYTGTVNNYDFKYGEVK